MYMKYFGPFCVLNWVISFGFFEAAMHKEMTRYYRKMKKKSYTDNFITRYNECM